MNVINDFTIGNVKIIDLPTNGLSEAIITFNKIIQGLEIDRWRVSEHILIKTTKPIFYDGKLLYKENEEIKFFHNGFNKEKILKVVLDFRPLGVFGSDFNYHLLSNYLNFEKDHGLIPYFYHKSISKVPMDFINVYGFLEE